MKKLLIAALTVCSLPALSWASVEADIDMKIVRRDGGQQVLRITNNKIDASVLDQFWGGIRTLGDAVSATVNFWSFFTPVIAASSD